MSQGRARTAALGWPVKALVVLVGVLAGVGGFTFTYAEGLSYLSTDPAACRNCHIMQPQYDSWQKSGHHTVAACVDCHLPAGFVGKYVAKAENGYHHSRGFTFQDFHEPIMIKPKNAAILEANCRRCHAAMTHELLQSGTGRDAQLKCTHCHAGTGHGERASLGGPPDGS